MPYVHRVDPDAHGVSFLPPPMVLQQLVDGSTYSVATSDILYGNSCLARHKSKDSKQYLSCQNAVCYVSLTRKGPTSAYYVYNVNYHNRSPTQSKKHHYHK